MKNMTVNIYFFRNTQKGRIEFEELVKYFMDTPNFEIFYNDTELNMVYNDTEFGFKYMYKKTKVSQVENIWRLDPGYLNLNFILCLPILIPSFAAKEILTFAQKLAKLFDLQVYHESYDDVKQFNIADLYSVFSNAQRAYLAENSVNEKVFYDANKLNTICKYQRSLDSYVDSFQNEVDVHPCVPIIDRANSEFGICSTWTVGVPTLFVPHFDFVNVKDSEGEEFYIRRADFMHVMDKYLTKVDNDLPDMFYIKAKAAKQSRGLTGRLRRYAIVDQVFEQLPICDLLDRY